MDEEWFLHPELKLNNGNFTEKVKESQQAKISYTDKSNVQCRGQSFHEQIVQNVLVYTIKGKTVRNQHFWHFKPKIKNIFPLKGQRIRKSSCPRRPGQHFLRPAVLFDGVWLYFEFSVHNSKKYLLK